MRRGRIRRFASLTDMQTRSRVLRLASLIIATATITPTLSRAADFESGPALVPLIELYTSEGCSSCPPANEWINARRDDPGLWRGFVPIALHVDYWDDLGWPDRYASAAFTKRQREYDKEELVNGVYTPAFVRAGKDWRPGQPVPEVADKKPGKLRLTIDDGRAKIVFHPTKKPSGELKVRLAALGMNRTTHVRNGENVGRLLRHDFVALEVESADLSPSESGDFVASLDLPNDAEAVAAWVEAADSPAPIQAVGGWLQRPR